MLSEPESETGQCCHLSLQAVSGGETTETIRLRAQVGNQIMIMLIDSGSSHSFLNTEFAHRAQCNIIAAPAAQVKLANGSLVSCNQQVQQLSWLTQGHTFTTDMRVLELGGYDAVLGMEWLQSYSPMMVDWMGKSLQIPHKTGTVTLQGIQSGLFSLKAYDTGAYDTGVGAVLSQNNHPIAYLSKALGVNNRKLSVYEKEFLAVMMTINKWRPYLQRAPFTILTDHKSLVHLQDQIGRAHV